MIRVLAVALLALAVAAPAAHASRSQEAWFQDDDEQVNTSPGELRRTLERLQSLGVDRLRITVLWKAIAPNAGSRTRPAGFEASNPAAYGERAWARYDRVVREATERGMQVNLNVTGPGPLWANRKPPRRDIAATYEPSPGEYARFVGAVGQRFPDVSSWSIWNEPNHSGWLTPTWARRGGRWVERSASLYRELVDAAWVALQTTGHGRDDILIGETAPKGDRSKNVKRFMTPLQFVRALYCVDRRLRVLRGSAATRLECPRNGSGFRAAHPGLFAASGFAHHPYELLRGPSARAQQRDYVTLSSLNRLTRALDGAMRRHGSRRRLPLWLTEYGYETNPPDRFKPTYSQQARYINQAEYMAWRTPRVRSFGQFLLRDAGAPISLTFQSGLISRGGRRKPAYAAYRMPIWVTGAGRVWGLARPAATGERVTVEVQTRPRGSRAWQTVKRVRTSGPRNVLSTRIQPPRGGAVRLRWRGLTSRAHSVSVR